MLIDLLQLSIHRLLSNPASHGVSVMGWVRVRVSVRVRDRCLVDRICYDYLVLSNEAREQNVLVI